MPTLEEINSPEYQARIRKQAEEQLAPSRDLTLNEIGLGEQQLTQDTTDINRNYDSLTQSLREQAERSRKQTISDQSNLGLLRGSGTEAILGDIEKTLYKKSTETEQDRASKLANIALQRSGLGIKKAEVQQQYNASVSDLVNQILNRDIETENPI
jgi:DNA primase